MCIVHHSARHILDSAPSYLNVDVFKCFGSQFSLLDLLEALAHRLLLDLLVLLHDALLLPLFSLLAQTLFLSLAHLLELSLALLQLLFLTLDIQALQTLLAFLYGLAASQDALVLLTGVFKVGGGGLLALLLTFLLQKDNGLDSTEHIINDQDAHSMWISSKQNRKIR